MIELLALLPALLQARPSSDPAPPVVHELAPLAPSEPQACEELTFHAAPRALAAAAVTEDWPGFRGPRRDGRTRETHLATSWPAGGPPLVWEYRCGRGFASPAIAEGRLVLVHRAGGEILIDCLEPETGKRCWRHALPCAYRPRYIANDGPRSTPAIADGRVYVHAVEGQLLCLELATGRVCWERDTCKEFAIPQDFFGVVSSPLVSSGLLYQNLGAPGPCVAAFEARTGKLVWGSGPAWGPSCASPVLGTLGGKERLLVLAGGESTPPTGGLVVLEPSSGAELFRHPFRSKTVLSVNGASPVVAGERVFVTASYGTGSACLACRADGTFAELWKDRHLGLQFSTPVVEGGVLYLIDGVADRAGALVALDPETGATLARTELGWEDELEQGGAKTTVSSTPGEGSLLWADGRFLCLGDNGHLLWLAADRTGAKVLARAWLFGANESWVPPVVARGLLYVRQTKPARSGGAPPRLLCYDLRAP